MEEPYLTIAIFVLIGSVLALVAKIVFDGLFGSTSPWFSRSAKKPENLKLNKLIAALDFFGLAVAASIFAWHFGASALPEALVWYVALPIAGVCLIGRAKALLRNRALQRS